MPSRTRPSHNYLPDEWIKWRQFPSLMIKILSKMPTTVMEDLSWSDMLAHNTKVKTTPDEVFRTGIALPTITTDHVLSSDGERLAVFLKSGLDRPWKKEKHGELVQTVKEALTALHTVYSPHPPKKTNCRHKQHQAEDSASGKQGLQYFCLWKAIGRSQDDPVLSSDIINGGHRMNATVQFFRNITPLTQTISMLFEAVDPTTYNQYQTAYKHWLQNSALRAIHTTNRACFTSTSHAASRWEFLSWMERRDEDEEAELRHV